MLLGLKRCDLFCFVLTDFLSKAPALMGRLWDGKVQFKSSPLHYRFNNESDMCNIVQMSLTAVFYIGNMFVVDLQ